MTFPAPPRALRRELGRLAQLTALGTFALGQPVLDTLGRSPELVAFRGATRADIWWVGLTIVLLPPLVLWLLGITAGHLFAGARRPAHLASVFLLGGALGLQLAARIGGLESIPLGVVAVTLGLAGTLLVVRFALIRTWLVYASPVAVAVLILFTSFSPVSELTRPTSSVVEGVSITDPSRVVIVVFDELPLATLVGDSGGIDGELFPAFAQLADTASWFRNASTVASATAHAVPSLLTGQNPRPGTRPITADHPQNLFTALGTTHRLEVWEAVTRLCPSSLCRTPTRVNRSAYRSLLSDAFTVWRSQVNMVDAPDPLAMFAEEVGKPPPEAFADTTRLQPSRFRAFLDSFRDTPEHTLHYLHLMLPHTPSRYLPSGLEYEAPTELGPVWDDVGRLLDVWIDHPWPPALGRQRAVLQTRYVDELLGSMIAEMRRSGTWDDALVIVTSDHGRAFRPGAPVRALDPTRDPSDVLPEVMAIPLFIKFPGPDAGRIIDANAELIDVLPTIAATLGVELPWSTDGVPLTVAGAERPEKTFHQFVMSEDEVSQLRFHTAWNLDADAFLPLVFERGIQTLAPTDGDLRLHRVGPRGDMVGQLTTSFREGPHSALRARLDRPGAFDHVDPDSGTVPALVTGELLSTDGEAEVLVAVNGVVAGVSPTFAWDQRTAAFALLVPPQLLHEGPNRLDLFLVDGDDPPQLRRLPVV